MEEFPLDELVFHREPMLLLDRICNASQTGAVAELTVRSSNPFYLPGLGLPAYVGVELMAQTIAAVDGVVRRMAGAGPKIGFLLGCRRYDAREPYFPEGAKLTISVDLILTDGAMFSFSCRIQDGAEFASANMNVYAPADPIAFLKRDCA